MTKCTVRVLDEVNCQISGIDEVTLKKAADLVSYTVKNSQYMEIVRAKRWNGKKSLIDRRTGQTFRHILFKVLEPIAKAGYEIAVEDKRHQHSISVPEIENNLFEGFEYKRFKGIMEPHQVDAVNKLTSNGGGLILLPTASGKTVVTAALAQLYYQFGRVLIIVPRTDLALETRDTIQALGMPDCGAYFDEIKEHRHITVSTWQSLAMRPELFQDVNMVLVDECQGADAKELFKLLSQAGRHVPIRIGMTGTLPEDDLSRYQIICALGPIIYEKRAKELQDIGFLAACKIFILKYLDRYRSEYLDVRKEHQYYIDESRWQFRNKPRIAHLATFINTIKQDGNTLVLLRNREYGEVLHAALPGSIYLNGDDAGTLRHRVYREVNQQDNAILICTYGIASTGIDVARLFNLVLIEPGRESVPIVQSIGRGLRKADDKKSVLIYHIGSDCKFSIKHLAEVQAIYDRHEYPYETVEVDY